MTEAKPTMRWLFEINPAYSWFESFAHQFSSPDLHIIPDHEDDKPTVYSISSGHLDELDNEEQVWERAVALMAILNGVLFLSHGFEFRPIKLGFLYDNLQNKRCGTPSHYIDGIATPFSATSNSWLCHWKSHLNPYLSFESAMLGLAREDDISRGMLQFLGLNGCSWITLYALLDFMKTSGLTSKDIALLANTTQAELKRFTHTANSFAAIGPLCRHGDLGLQAPPIPMRIQEATTLIFAATQKFLVKRVNNLGLAAKWEAEKK